MAAQRRGSRLPNIIAISGARGRQPAGIDEVKDMLVRRFGASIEAG
jgi:hypothetical protein